MTCGNYNYNPVSGILDIVQSDEDQSEFIALKDYVMRLCTTFGFGVGMSGIISSTGPFSATMRELHDLFCERVAKEMHSLMNDTGTEELLLSLFINCVKHEQDRLRDIEIQVKTAMFKSFANLVREAF